MNVFFAFNSARKSTPGWFSREPSKPENNSKPEKEEESKNGQESMVDGSSESEMDHLVTKPEKSSDEEKKQVTKGDETEPSDEVQTCTIVIRNLFGRIRWFSSDIVLFCSLLLIWFSF